VNTSVPKLQLIHTHTHTHTHTLQADKTLCETGDKIGFWYCSCSDSIWSRILITHISRWCHRDVIHQQKLHDDVWPNGLPVWLLTQRLLVPF